MDNMSKIKKISNMFYSLFTVLIIILPIYYILYWLFINSLEMSSHYLSLKLQIIGFISSFLPLSALMYGLIHIKKLFFFYKNGIIFSSEQGLLFKKISKALALWILFTITYEAIKSVIFSWNNIEGKRAIEISFDSSQLGILIISIIILIVAWIMEEGRIINEENKLTV